MTSSRKLWLVLLAIGLLAQAPAAMAGPPRIIPINVPDAVATRAYGINPTGDIVGSYTDIAKRVRGFLLRDGVFSSIDVPGADSTEAYGITPQGDIVGQYIVAGVYHGFLLRDGTLTYPNDAPGKPNTMPYGVTPYGTIVGCVHGGPKGMHGFVLTADGNASFQEPVNTMHLGINSSGDIVGYGPEVPGGPDHGYLISDGVMSWFHFGGSLLTRPRGISATGDIVGVYLSADTKTHGFLLSHGEFSSIDVDSPGVIQTRAMGINAVGEIVGDYKDSTGTHGYVLTRRGGE